MAFVANRIRGNVKVAGIASWYVKADVGTKYQITANAGADTVTTPTAIFANTNTVKVSVGQGGVLPAGLSASTLYYVVGVSSATFGLSLTSGGAAVDITDAGTQPFYVGLTDAAFYNISNLYDGKIEVKTMSQDDSFAQPLAFGAEINATAKMFNTDKTNVLKTLDQLSTRTINHVINTRGSGSIQTNGLAIPTGGTKWKFVCDADSNKVRYIELNLTRKIDATEITALLTTAAPSYGTAVSTDALYTFNSLARTGIIPAGFRSFEICATYNGTFQDIGNIKNGKLIIELLTSTDSLGREVGYAMKIDVEVEGMQASATELAQLQALATQATYFKITLLDGTVVTLGNVTNQQLGINWAFTTDKDSTGEAYIKFVGSGIVQSTELDGIFV